MFAAENTGFSPVEQAVLDAVGTRPDVTVAYVVREASRSQPTSSVRDAYWSLVSGGVLEAKSTGQVVHIKPA